MAKKKGLLMTADLENIEKVKGCHHLNANVHHKTKPKKTRILEDKQDVW